MCLCVCVCTHVHSHTYWQYFLCVCTPLQPCHKKEPKNQVRCYVLNVMSAHRQIELTTAHHLKTDCDCYECLRLSKITTIVRLLCIKTGPSDLGVTDFKKCGLLDKPSFFMTVEIPQRRKIVDVMGGQYWTRAMEIRVKISTQQVVTLASSLRYLVCFQPLILVLTFMGKAAWYWGARRAACLNMVCYTN